MSFRGVIDEKSNTRNILDFSLIGIEMTHEKH